MGLSVHPLAGAHVPPKCRDRGRERCKLKKRKARTGCPGLSRGVVKLTARPARNAAPQATARELSRLPEWRCTRLPAVPADSNTGPHPDPVLAMTLSPSSHSPRLIRPRSSQWPFWKMGKRAFTARTTRPTTSAYQARQYALRQVSDN